MACPTCVRSAYRRASHHGGAERDSQGASPSERSSSSSSRVSPHNHFESIIYEVYTKGCGLKNLRALASKIVRKVTI